MCGIIGLLLSNENEHVNQMIFDGLTVLQHRGQDAAGIVTASKDSSGSNAKSVVSRLHLRKDNGLVKDVFQTHHMIDLKGNVGIGHVRYPTAGSSSCAEAQPLYTNYPYGICVAHNGNLTNTSELLQKISEEGRHINTDSDSELLLNIFAHNLTTLLQEQKNNRNGNNNNNNMVNTIFTAIEGVMKQCKGGYAGVYLINGIGLVGFRDPHGIRPMVFGTRPASQNGNNDKLDYVMASESVAIDTLGFTLKRDIKAGESIFIDLRDGQYYSKICASSSPSTDNPSPCIFEYVYFARPDSIMDGISVYETRLKMGEKLANKINKVYPNHNIDVVIPIPDTSRTCALQAAYCLNKPFREGFIKNRYIARTFIMPGQEIRKKSVRLKLNTIKSEFKDRNVLLVDDSIVRGTTANGIVNMAREAGAKKVFFCSAAPPIRFPNIYGIDIPTRQELIAYERSEDEIAKHIGCDWVVYQDLHDLEQSIIEVGLKESPTTCPKSFDTSCFSGTYVTGEKIGDSYFTKLYENRNENDAFTSGNNNNNDNSKKNKTINNSNHSSASGGAVSCESVNNDQRSSTPRNDKCESLHTT